MVKIAVIDDDDGLRRAVSALLDMPQRTIQSFSCGQDFLEVVSDTNFDAAVLDLRMPGMTGLQVLESLLPLSFPVIMMSADGDIRSAIDAIRLGANDFLEKPFTPEALDAAIDKALIAGAQSPTHKDHPFAQSRVGASLSELTPREKEVALALNEGLTNKEVARELGCSPRTVEVHRSRVFTKLGVTNIAGLVRTMSGLQGEHRS